MMNEHNQTFDLTDSILRVLGIIGFFAAVIFGFVVAGGNVITLVHPAEIIIVVGTIFFGLLCTHRSKFIAYLPTVLLALVRKTGCQSRVLPNIRQCKGYAAAGGGMAVILSLICTMSNHANLESVGLRVAAAMSGVFVAMLLSQLFVYLRYSFSENASS